MHTTVCEFQLSHFGHFKVSSQTRCYIFQGHPIEVSSFVENLRNRMADHLQQQYMIQQQQENNEGAVYTLEH